MNQPNLNMRQRRWLDVVNDYDFEILYHSGKGNVVVNALSHKLVTAPIRYICMRMTLITPLVDLILEARVEDMKEEH